MKEHPDRQFGKDWPSCHLELWQVHRLLDYKRPIHRRFFLETQGYLH